MPNTALLTSNKRGDTVQPEGELTNYLPNGEAGASELHISISTTVSCSSLILSPCGVREIDGLQITGNRSLVTQDLLLYYNTIVFGALYCVLCAVLCLD